MPAHPIPLVPPYTLWISAGEDVAPALQTAIAARVEPLGYDVKDLSSTPNALVRAQGVFHDIRTLLREADSLTALWAIASGHCHSVIIASAARPSRNSGLGYETYGVPAGNAKFRLATVHRHLFDDRPDIVAHYLNSLETVFAGRDIGLSEVRLGALQAEADAFYQAGLLPVRVHIRDHILNAAPVRAQTVA